MSVSSVSSFSDDGDGVLVSKSKFRVLSKRTHDDYVYIYLIKAKIKRKSGKRREFYYVHIETPECRCGYETCSRYDSACQHTPDFYSAVKSGVCSKNYGDAKQIYDTMNFEKY